MRTQGLINHTRLCCELLRPPPVDREDHIGVAEAEAVCFGHALARNDRDLERPGGVEELLAQLVDVDPLCDLGKSRARVFGVDMNSDLDAHKHTCLLPILTLAVLPPLVLHLKLTLSSALAHYELGEFHAILANKLVALPSVPIPHRHQELVAKCPCEETKLLVVVVSLVTVLQRLRRLLGVAELERHQRVALAHEHVHLGHVLASLDLDCHIIPSPLPVALGLGSC
mmetsp:Transcript_45322/g.110355  ORF Transcript_45322/g.110355 Transcript_45322/m.110355 type:complete len:227 (-) Transcript_45322:393-1073(-)